MSKPVVASSAISQGRAPFGRPAGAGEPELPDINIVYSTSSDRSSPLPLDGATVSGTIYVWLDNTEPDRVVFAMDTDASDAELEAWVLSDSDPSPALVGQIRGDRVFPFDMKGGPASAANPWPTGEDPVVDANRPLYGTDGASTLKVGARFGTQTSVTSATFTRSNSSVEPVYPQTPTGLAADVSVDNQVTLTWTATDDDVEGFDNTVSYRVRLTPGGTRTSSTFFHVESPLSPGAYTAEVRGVDAQGDESPWSAPVSFTVTGETNSFDNVTAWYQFYPAGNGIDPQPNSVLAGFVKGVSLETQSGFTDDMQYPQRGWAWQSPVKFGTNFKNSVSNLISGSPTSAVEREASMRSQRRLRKAQAPEFGGFGSEIGDGDYGAGGSTNFVLSQHKHPAKSYINPNREAWKPNTSYNVGKRLVRSGIYYRVNADGYTSPSTFDPNDPFLTVEPKWVPTRIATSGGDYTPGVPASTSYAEDSALGLALALSGALNTRLQAMAIELIDNRSGGQDYGYWLRAIFIRLGWEIWGPWSSDYAGINPNLGSSTILRNAANYDNIGTEPAGYGLNLSDRARELLHNLATHPADGGYPKYEVFHPASSRDGYPGYHEMQANPTPSAAVPAPYDGPDDYAGYGGDLSLLFAEAYCYVFDYVYSVIVDQCALRGIDPHRPLISPNMGHPGADPESASDGAGLPDNGEATGWKGTGSAPGGGDLFQPVELSRQTNLRVLDRIGRDRIACIDIDFYLRNSLLSDWENEIPLFKTHVQEMVLRYLRPFASSECGWTARSGGAIPGTNPTQYYTKDNAPVDRVKLARALWAIHNPYDGLIASVPTAYIVHYLPDGNANGEDRYRLVKSLDNVGETYDNPWWVASQLWPGRLTNLSDFVDAA